jgi:MFS family permease
MIIDALGSGVFLPFTLLFFVEAAGLPLVRVGLAVSAAAAVSLPASLPFGWLVDRFGPRGILVLANVARCLVFAFYPLVHSLGALFVAVLAASLCDKAYWSAHAPFIGVISQSGERGRWFGLVSALRNLGLGLGALAGGVLVSADGSAGLRALALVNAASFAVAALLLSRERAGRRPAAAAPRGGHGRSDSPTLRAVARDWPFLSIVAAKLAFVICALAMTLVLPLYLIRNLGLPAWIAGTVFAANCVLVVTAQSGTVHALERRSRISAIGVAGVLYAAAGAVFWCSGALNAAEAATAAVAIAAMLIYTCGEMIVSPTSDALATDSSPAQSRGRYLSVYQLSWSVGGLVTPIAATALLARGASWFWLTFIAIALAGAVLIRGARPTAATAALPAATAALPAATAALPAATAALPAATAALPAATAARPTARPGILPLRPARRASGPSSSSGP